jgi:hypothetical protein
MFRILWSGSWEIDLFVKMMEKLVDKSGFREDGIWENVGVG